MKCSEEAARQWAIRTALTRCSGMGSDACAACVVRQCDYRSRREAFLEGFSRASAHFRRDAEDCAARTPIARQNAREGAKTKS